MNRRNILKSVVGIPFIGLPLMGEEKSEYEGLLPFQVDIMEDIKKFRHNIFILPRGCSKTWMCNYIAHDGNLPPQGERVINRKNRYTIHGDYFIYDEMFDQEDFNNINRPIVHEQDEIKKYKKDFYNKICDKRLILFTSINNEFANDLLKRAYKDRFNLVKGCGLNIKKLSYQDINKGFKLFDQRLLNEARKQLGERNFKRSFKCEFV